MELKNKITKIRQKIGINIVIDVIYGKYRRFRLKRNQNKERSDGLSIRLVDRFDNGWMDNCEANDVLWRES